MALYTGTFEPYQRLDLLTEAAALLRVIHPAARILVVGGASGQVEQARQRGAVTGSPMIFTGQRPTQEIPGFVAACDVLVWPRTSGTNTPLKIYSYLRSGRPIVATDLRTHTQVLNSDTALLVPPEANGARLRAGSPHRSSGGTGSPGRPPRARSPPHATVPRRASRGQRQPTNVCSREPAAAGANLA